MLQAIELKIGNAVKVGDMVFIIPNGTWIDEHYDVCDGIQLTPEILEKLGFEKSEPPVSDQWYNHKINWAYYLNSGSLFIGCDNENGYEIPVKIKSLHHLQNLYFDLYGEEYPIKLSTFI